MRSRILDRGAEVMEYFPPHLQRDARGNELWTVDDNNLPEPIVFRATTSYDRGAKAELTGQVNIPVLRVLTRFVPGSVYGRIRYAGQMWDIAAPPRQTPGATSSLQHTEFTIRGRNTLPRPDQGTADVSSIIRKHRADPVGVGDG